MEDARKTKVQLIEELAELRQRIAESEAVETEHKRVEKALKDSEARYQDLYDNAPDMFVSVDAATGKIIQCNQILTTATGYTKEEIIGCHISEMYHPDCEEFRQRVFQTFVETGAVHNAELQLRRKDGSKIEVTLNVSAVRDEQGHVLYSRSVWRDITERKQVEEERERLIGELDAYAHTVAHNLKNPLSITIGYLLFIEDVANERLDDDLRSYFNTITKSCHKMQRIVDELLLFASVRKIEDVKTTRLDMAEIVAAAQERLTFIVSEVNAEIILPHKWPTALGYTPWIEDIWANYISNAIKYGGKPPRVELGANAQPGGMIRFWVQDNGEGLTEEEQAQLFTQFSRLAQVKAEGHGLGLSIVQRIVKKLGGEVSIESEVGKGSQFCFTLPMAKA